MHLKKEKSAESNAIAMLQVGHDSKVCTQINKCEGLICTCAGVGDGKQECYVSILNEPRLTL